MKDLSSKNNSRIHILPPPDGQDYSENLSRETLDQLCEDLFHATLTTIDRVFHDAPAERATHITRLGVTNQRPRTRGKVHPSRAAIRECLPRIGRENHLKRAIKRVASFCRITLGKDTIRT
jgi:hypothetical protein